MTTTELGLLISRNAGQDLSSSQWCFVDCEASTGDVVLPSAGGRAIGVVQNDPVDNAVATVAVTGVSQVIAGGTVTAGDNVKVAATGKVVTASAADVTSGALVGVALTGGAVNERIEVLILPNNQAQGSAIETVTSGAISVATRTSLLSITGTVAFTLAAGSYEGQRKRLECTVAASTPAGTVTATFITGVTATTGAAFNAVGDVLELEYHATGGWRVLTNVSVTLS